MSFLQCPPLRQYLPDPRVQRSQSPLAQTYSGGRCPCTSLFAVFCFGRRMYIIYSWAHIYPFLDINSPVRLTIRTRWSRLMGLLMGSIFEFPYGPNKCQKDPYLNKPIHDIPSKFSIWSHLMPINWWMAVWFQQWTQCIFPVGCKCRCLAWNMLNLEEPALQMNSREISYRARWL